MTLQACGSAEDKPQRQQNASATYCVIFSCLFPFRVSSLFSQAFTSIFHTHMPRGGDICVNERQGPNSVVGSPPKTGGTR